ncbi:MAG: serine/threonine protein kinase [Polyangiaceae bacterium]
MIKEQVPMRSTGGHSSWDRSGQTVGDRYRLLSVLGRGGQGVVYEAQDQRYGDLVAIKVLNDSLTKDPDFRERMFREGRAMTQLTGTAAVRVLDQVWSPDGALCLVMERLYGLELDDVLAQLEQRGQRMPAQAVVDMLGPVVSTLERAHQLGIVHRDLKPGNIFLIDDEHGGGVRVLDFGFAKFVRMRGFTADGTIAGSPTYIAPETWKGGKIDGRVDVYALGAIVFRCLAGQPPFDNKNLGALLVAVTEGERPSLHKLRTDLNPGIDFWVQQALAANPDERFLGVRALFNSLKSVLAA